MERTQRSRSVAAEAALMLLTLFIHVNAVSPASFAHCRHQCYITLGRGVCQEDGTCTCNSGWTGEGCAQVGALTITLFTYYFRLFKESPGISKERRRDGSYGYSFTTYDAEKSVGAAVFDTKKNVLYLSVYDGVSGANSVIEVDPLSPTAYTQGGLISRGWGPTTGPNRASATTKQPNPMAPDLDYCGTALGIQTATGCATAKHPRAEGYIDSSTASISKGWYSVFRGLALDLSGSLTGVYGVLNMHHNADPDLYLFRIVKYIGTDCSVAAAWEDCVTGSANAREPSFAYPATGNTAPGILDAMSSNEATGHVIYKVSPTDGTSTATLGMLTPTLTLVLETAIQANILNTKATAKGCSSCATAFDALKFETAMYAQTGGTNYVIFAGAARMETDGTSYPAIFKVQADRADFTAANGAGTEMYLDDTTVRVESICEGAVDPKQGRLTTITTLTMRGSYGYAGTSGRDDSSPHRSACIFMFSLDFTEDATDGPIAMIALNGGNGGLEEKDVWAAAVEPDNTLADGGFIYFAVGARSNTGFGRIVKVMIGGNDTTSSCTLGCFKRVGTYKEIVSFGGIAYVADLHGIVSLSQAALSTTYTKFSTASVTSISPQFVHATTTGAMITVTGTGFYNPVNDDATNKSHTTSCRFGHSSSADEDFQAKGWSAATYISSTEIRCSVPSASDSMSTNKTFSEMQISFDGFPVNGNASSATFDPALYWQRSLWSNDNAVVLYFDTPLITALDVSSTGDFISKLMLTGEDPDNFPVTLRIYGGQFIDSDGSDGTARLTCRYDGNASSDIAGTFVSVSEVHCPLCATSNASGSSRCGALGTEGAAQYIPLVWLKYGIPKPNVAVSITMNGVDYHSSEVSILHVYGMPYGVGVKHSRITAQAYLANAESDGTLKLDRVTVDLIDVQGTPVPNDMGLGNTRGFTVIAAVNETGSTGGSSAGLAVTAASATRSTVNGTATFDIVLNIVPLVGLYEIYFIGADCTDGTVDCVALGVTAAFLFTIKAGIATGLVVDPGGTSGLFVTGPDFPADAIDVTASASVPVGYVVVNTVDAGGNKLESLDVFSHSITASVVTAQIISGVHAARVTGAILAGTISKSAATGFAVFSDLSLDAMTPFGSRTPYMDTDVTYGEPTRGIYGTESKYLVQFSATFAASTMVAHTVVRLSVGTASYLRLNSSYSVISIDATEIAVRIPHTIELGAYDGGNNWVGTLDSLNRTVTASSHSDPALVLAGTLSTSMDATGTWTFATANKPLFAVAPKIGEYTLRFTSDGLQPTDQIVRVTLGRRGHELFADLPADFGPYFSASIVNFNTFTVQVLDGGGNFMSTSDRFEPSDVTAVTREIKFSSNTLQLTGTTTIYAFGNGLSTSNALACVAPTAGTHMIVASEVRAMVNGGDVGTSLNNGSFYIIVLKGDPSKLNIDGSPVTLYTSSTGANLLAAEVNNYATDRLVPLDRFTLFTTDEGANMLTSFSNYYINTTVVDSSVTTSKTTVLLSTTSPENSSFVRLPPELTVHAELSTVATVRTFRNVTMYTVVSSTNVTTFNTSITYSVTSTFTAARYVTASINDTSREAYPYTTSNNEIFNREAVLVAGLTFPRSGSTSVPSTSGIAVFSALHLSKPAVGMYKVIFSSSDTAIKAAAILITVSTGRSQQLGLPIPCPVATDASGYRTCKTSIDCTCNRYLATPRVALNTLEVTVLDAGFNPVFDNDTLPCEICTTREVSFTVEQLSVVVCRENLTSASGTCECMGGDHTSQRSLSGNVCVTVSSFSVVAVKGVARFQGIYFITPTVSAEHGIAGYKLQFSSLGLLDVSFGIIVTEGTGYALKVEAPSQFPLPATSQTTFRSSFVTEISSVLETTAVRVLILDGGGNFIKESEPSGRIIYAACTTATLEKYPQGIGVGGSYYAVTCMRGRCESGEEAGIAKFRHLQFLRPKVGTHVIKFSGLGFTIDTSYTVSVLQGDPVALKFATFSPTAYRAKTFVNFAVAEVAVVDAGDNLVGSFNPITRLLRVTITGPRHTFVIDNNQDEAILLQGRGAVTFDRLSLDTPEAGEYTLTVSSSPLMSAVQTITVNLGPPTRLYIPVAFNLSSGMQIVPETVYTSLKLTVLKPVVVLILDGGLNYIVDAVRNVTVTSESGKMTHTIRNSSLGFVLFDDITFHGPSVGTYRITFTSDALIPITQDITIKAGYPAILDACRSNVLLTRTMTTSPCYDSEAYESNVQVTLRDFQVSILDAGRGFVGNSWNSESRNVTMVLESFTDTSGVRIVNFSGAIKNPLQTDMKGTQRVRDGLVGWCKDGFDVNPVVTKKTDSETGEQLESTVYTDSSPSFCRKMSYSGNAPDFHFNAGAKFSYPKAGIYLLRFTSECPFKFCGNAIYPNLETDTLQIKIVPGTPFEMRFADEPPAVNENDFRLDPKPSIDVFDVAGNLCTLTNTFMTVDIAPRSLRLHGNFVPLVEGRGTFPLLRFSGERGIIYRLIFGLHAYSLKLEYSPFVILSCEAVKSNSQPDEKGRCHCLPGYTEDTVNGTGFVDDLDNYNVAGVRLYGPVVYDTGWLKALNPYGVCVPCSNGYFKPHTGSHSCSKCPNRFDTSRKDGLLSPPYNSSSGRMLPGSLGRVRKEDCHCIAQLEPPFDSFYRNTSTSEKYKCEPCPRGGRCTGQGIEEIRAQPGYKRVSRSTTIFTACPSPDACLGGTESTCRAVNGSGYSGTLCATCLPGYARPSINGKFPPKCVICGNVGLNVAQFLLHWIAVVAVIAILARLNVRRGSDAVCLIKTFVSYLQTISIAKELNMKWPDSAAGYMLLIEKLSSVNFQSAPAQCLISWDYYSTTGFYIMLPIALGAFCILYFSIFQFLADQKDAVSSMRRRKAQVDDFVDEENENEDAQSPILNSKVLRTKRRIEAMDDASFGESWKSQAFDQVCMIGVIGLWFMYPTLVQHLVGLIRCRRLDGGDNVYLIADLSIKCYSATHSSWLFLLFILTVLYIFGIPLGLIGLLEREGRNHSTLAMRYRVGILYKGHDVDNAWWWEFVTFGRKMVLVAVVVLCSDSARMGSYLAVWLLEICFIAHILALPYANERQHRIESYGLLAAIITFNCGIVYIDGSGDLVSAVLTLVIFAVHIGMWCLLVKSLLEEFAIEGRTAMIGRAQHDIKLEDTVVTEFESRRGGEAAEDKKAEKLAQLNSIAGAHLPFADDDLLEHIEKGSVSEIREQHTKLSSKLTEMRKTWDVRRAKNAGIKYLVDEAHRGEETTAAERWRRQKDSGITTLVAR